MLDMGRRRLNAISLTKKKVPAKENMFARLCILLIALVAACPAQDVVAVSPEYRVEFENAWVRVLRVKQPAHVKIALHSHPDSVGVFLTDAHEKVTTADGTIRDVVRKAGDVSFNPAVTHFEENVADQSRETILIELKSGAPHGPKVAIDPVKVDPKHHIVVVENDRVRAIRTTLEPHLKSPMHEHPHYVVVYMTDLHTTMKMSDGRVVDNPRHRGDVAWRDALKHETEQEGDKTAEEIQVEIK
jgi:hypothetical protein